jgi:predicted acetylornithine/succinylornithine family transaminase
MTAEMTTKETIELFEKHVVANYTRYPIVFVRGEGSYLWDADGKKYIDLFPGWAVDGLGHCPPRVVEAIREQAGKLIHVANNFYTEPQGVLAKELADVSFGGRSFFCNSGAEAVEAALKCARLWGSAKAETSDSKPRYKIITMRNSFHGRTYGAITATAQEKYHQGLGPMLPGFTYIEFNDLDAVKDAADDETVAVMVEPVQGEGGINIASPDYMKGLRELCDGRGMLLVCDEVQTGMGRTGEWFAYQHYDVTPDLMTLAKSLGGGVAIGALVGKPDVISSLKPGTHASTFGGNPLAAAAAVATIRTIREENLIEHARETGRYLGERLEAMKSKFAFAKAVRQLGLMCALELDCPGAEIVKKCLAKGLHINCTHETVIRLIPATNVPRDVLDEGLGMLEGVLAEEG